jgi:GTP pyrophosphokinase
VSQIEAALALLHKQEHRKIMIAHASLLEYVQGMQDILQPLGLDDTGEIAACFYPLLAQPVVTGAERTQLCNEIVAQFGQEVLDLIEAVCKLEALDQKIFLSNPVQQSAEFAKQQIEILRKMLLAFARDIRVVLIRLAAVLQALRNYARLRISPAVNLVHQVRDVYAPLANRLGIWQIKWELEDLAFRFAQPETYHRIAKLLDEKRIEREAFIQEAITRLQDTLAAAHIQAEVFGRAKHIYSIWRKMRGKERSFDGLYDVRALRIIVPETKDCYAALGVVHNLWQPIPKEFDDYISRPKPNGYRSLHTVVMDQEQRALEVQIRTREMHQFAEFGVAAHWRYKETGAKGYTGQFSASSEYETKIAWLRQLLAWKNDASAVEDENVWHKVKQAELDDHIYVLTPDAHIVALPEKSTPIDFAYYLHTELGHCCRGARVDGAIVPLNTPLQNGQTVEVISIKQGGPSRDWLNPALGYLASSRARAKVRAWFNALEQTEILAQGRAMLEKTLQREGKTALNLEAFARDLGFSSLDELSIALAKEKLSMRYVERILRGEQQESNTATESDANIQTKSSAVLAPKGHVLVVGVDALLTQLAKCCRPAPPDAIMGFVTKGKGVSIHRTTCPAFIKLKQCVPERVIETTWGKQSVESVYPIDVVIEAVDRQGLLRDCMDAFARDKIHVAGVRSWSGHNAVRIQFTVDVVNMLAVQGALNVLKNIHGVLSVRRK